MAKYGKMQGSLPQKKEDVSFIPIFFVQMAPSPPLLVPYFSHIFELSLNCMTLHVSRKRSLTQQTTSQISSRTKAMIIMEAIRGLLQQETRMMIWTDQVI